MPQAALGRQPGNVELARRKSLCRDVAEDSVHDLTAAHPRLAFGTRVKVTHLDNNRFVFVRVNDRGPFIKGRVIDLSQAAATALQMDKRGLAQVKLEVVE